MRSWFGEVGASLQPRFRFGQVEAALQLMHCVSSDAAPGFRARLRNLKRAGLNIGDNRPGRRANLTIGDAVTIALAVELGKLGNAPERSAQILAGNADALAEATRMVLVSSADVLLTYFPDAWGQGPAGMFGPGEIDTWTVKEFASDEPFSIQTRMAIINFSHVWRELVAGLSKEQPEQALREDLAAWSDQLEKWSDAAAAAWLREQWKGD